MRSHLTLILFVVMLAFACRTGPAENAQAAKDTILRYNQLLAAGYAKLNMDPLQAVAAADQAAKEYRHMAALGEAKIRMEPVLKSIEFEGISFASHDKASAITRETWDYTHIDMRTGVAVEVQKNVTYRLKYGLEKKNTRWYVVSVEAVDKK